MATRSNRTRNVKPRPATSSAAKPQPVAEEPVEEAVVADVEENETATEDTTPAIDETAADTGDSEDETDGDSEEVAEQSDLDDTDFRKYWQEYLDKSGVTPPKGHILFPGEPMTFRGDIVRGDIVVLKEDVYRMVIAFRSTRPSFVLEAVAGTEVPKVRVVTKTEYRKAVGGLFDSVLES